MLASAAADRFGVHALTEDPAEAEIILFVGAGRKYHGDIKASPLVRQYPRKGFVYDEQDNVIPSLPGVYTGLRPDVARRPFFRTGFFLRVFDNDRVVHQPDMNGCSFLYSFRGRASNARVRRAVLGLQHPRAYLRDSDSGQSDQDVEYAETLQASKFVLCPRGLGPSTWRLYETMKAGRVPVILSDEWVPPRGPDWHQFSLRVAEKDCAQVPELCEKLEWAAPEMGRIARHAWENWFSREAAFHRVVDWCLAIRYETGGVDYRVPGDLMPLRTLTLTHLVPFWKEYARDRLTAAGLWGKR
jgi:hypothetical protein